MDKELKKKERTTTANCHSCGARAIVIYTRKITEKHKEIKYACTECEHIWITMQTYFRAVTAPTNINASINISNSAFAAIKQNKTNEVTIQAQTITERVILVNNDTAEIMQVSIIDSRKFKKTSNLIVLQIGEILCNL